MSCFLWLVRHGQSLWNRERRAQGWADPPLTELGIWQAQQIARRLIDTEIHAVYSSSLQRAVHTAEIISAITNVPVLTDDQLKEVGVGEVTGLIWQDAVLKWPELADTGALGLPVWDKIPGTEPLLTSQTRIQAAFDAICSQHSEGNIVVVAHGGVFRIYLSMLFKSPSFLSGIHFDNASLSRLRIGPDGRVTIFLLNDTSHLDAPAID